MSRFADDVAVPFVPFADDDAAPFLFRFADDAAPVVPFRSSCWSLFSLRKNVMYEDLPTYLAVLLNAKFVVVVAYGRSITTQESATGTRFVVLFVVLPDNSFIYI